MKSLLKITLLTSLTLILFSGCVASFKNAFEPKQDQVSIDPNLPIVELNGHIEDMTSIAFEWKEINSTAVEGVYIYRNDPTSEEKELHRIDKTDNRFATHYVDSKLTPGTQYQYAFSTYNAKDQESVASEMTPVKTLPLLESVSYFHATDNMPRSAKLIWRPHTNIDVDQYQIERRAVQRPDWKNIKRIKGRLNAEFIDVKLDDDTSYTYRIKVITYSGILSRPSNDITIKTKPLPVPVLNLKATSNIPSSIVISWSQNPEEDIAHYNVYRSTRPTGGFDVIAKVKGLSFRDNLEGNGAIRYYKVTAVDKDGLESFKDIVPLQGSTLPQPETPVLTSAKASENQIVLKWKATDQRTSSYVIVKTIAINWFEKSTEEITDIVGTTFKDSNIQPNITYSYELMSVDASGIRSKPTETVKFDIKAN
ncbi:MAG: hypothetical protein GQ570_13245 [Helicobacteraceae bacterium]|nr:hypothetical protein [Helicobacteraceae bacterium]